MSESERNGKSSIASLKSEQTNERQSRESSNYGVRNFVGGIRNTMHDLGNRINPNSRYTTAIIKQYRKHADGVEGVLPLQMGFARQIGFWKVFTLLIVTSSIMAFVAIAYMNCTNKIPALWVTCDYDHDISCGDYYSGKLWWIGVTGGCGFLVGLLRYIAKYPRALPGLFKDINDCHVDPFWCLFTYFFSMISISGGANLGPEQALSSAGGGLATWIVEQLEARSTAGNPSAGASAAASASGDTETPSSSASSSTSSKSLWSADWWFSSDLEYKKLFILGGMAGPLAALFQAPMLGALVIHELGAPPKSFLESSTLLGIACVTCFSIYYELVSGSYINNLTDEGAELSDQWIQSKGYRSWMVATGMCIGAVSAVLCIMTVLVIEIAKLFFNKIRMKLKRSRLAQEIVPPILGGIIIGVTNWALPATVGNGTLVNHYFIKYGGVAEWNDDQFIITTSTGQSEEVLSIRLLMCTGFARMALLGVSLHSGFVGGTIFPFITLGVIAGVAAFQHYPSIPLGLFVASFMVAIPCGTIPAPFAFTCVAAFAFYFGLNQTVPVFSACVTSSLLVQATGILKAIEQRAAQFEDGKSESERGSSSTVMGINCKHKAANGSTSESEGPQHAREFSLSSPAAESSNPLYNEDIV